MRRRIAAAIPILAVSALVLACFGRLMLHPSHLIVDGDHPSVDDFQKIERREVGNDLTQLFLPHHMRIAAQVALGRLPSAWDSSGFCGRPRVGNPQAGLFYPPVWLAWWSGRPSALGWLTVAHLIFAGIGVLALAKRSGSGPFASTIAAGIFPTSPYVLAQVFEGHYPHVWGACWYPWAFLAAGGLRRGDFRGMIALPPILAMAGLTGHPQEAYYLAIAIGAWLSIDAFSAIRRGETRRSIASIVAWAAVLALTIGLAAIELVPDAQASAWGRQTDRMTVIEASKYHVDFLNLAQILGPRALGGPSDYFGHDNYWETVLSIGWVPVVLALIGLWHFKDRKTAKAWAWLALLSVLFAGGWRLGIFAVLYEVVPGMERFRVPARSLFLASLAGAMLAGFGVEALRSGSTGMRALNWPRQRRRLLILLLVLGIGQAIASSWRLEDRRFVDRPGSVIVGDRRPRSSGNREVGRWALAASRLLHDPSVLLALGGSAAAMAWLHRRPWDGKRVAIGFGALTWLELAWLGSTLLKTAPADRFLGADPVAEAIDAQAVDRPFRIRARDGFYTDLRAAAAGFEKTNLNDAFQVGRAADLYETLYPMFGPFRAVPDRGAMAGAVEEWRAAIRQAVLDRLGVAFLVTDRRPPGARWPVVDEGIWGKDRFTVYRNPTALPRAYVVHRAIILDEGRSDLSAFLRLSPRDAVILERLPGTRGVTTAQLPHQIEEGRPRPDREEAGLRQPFLAANYESENPDRVVVTVETTAPSFLVVADTWMPGWSATVDGNPEPILRGNHAQRVVPLTEPGDHRVIMRYQTPGLMFGMALTGLSGAVWLILALSAFLRTKTSIFSPSWPSRIRSGRPSGCTPPSRISAGCSRSS